MTDRPVFADQVEWVPADTLHDYPGNPRQADVGAIHQSVEANGTYRPVYAQRSSRTILAGHHLRTTLTQRGNELIPVLWLDVDDATARRIVLADNRVPDLGTYAEDNVTALLEAIVNDQGVEGLLGTGYDGDDLDARLGQDEPLRLGPNAAQVITCPNCEHSWTPGGEV